MSRAKAEGGAGCALFPRKRKASRYKGVYKCGSKWKAQIQSNGVQHYLGVFDSEDSAAEVYTEMWNRLHPAMDSCSDSHDGKAGHLASDVHNMTTTTTTASSMDMDELPAHEQTHLRLKLRLGQVIRSLNDLNQPDSRAAWASDWAARDQQVRVFLHEQEELVSRIQRHTAAVAVRTEPAGEHVYTHRFSSQSSESSGSQV